MKEIEEGLHVLHASARDTKKDTSEEEMDTSHGIVFVLIVSITHFSALICLDLFKVI